MLPIVAGVFTALALAAAGRLTGFDRDRSFYPTLLIVIASYYLLFAVIGGDVSVMVVETGIVLFFSALALLGGFRSMVWVGAGIFIHGVFDVAHGHLINNAGVPAWWPAYCAAVDVPLGLWVAALGWRNAAS